MINAIYNKDVLRLAADITCIGALESPDAIASFRSPLCGSSIKVSITMTNGRITNYGQEIKACALGQASAQEMLSKGTMLPEGDWSALVALAPAKEAKSRHGAILLPFDALLKALTEKKV